MAATSPRQINRLIRKLGQTEFVLEPSLWYYLDMFNKVLIPLMLINLIACPLRCGACAFDSADAAESTSLAFSCCGACDSVPQADLPQAPGDDADCGCQDCICNGAVLVDASPEVATFPSSKHWFSAQLSDQTASNIARQNFFGHSIRNASSPGGIDARIAYQSWQL